MIHVIKLNFDCSYLLTVENPVWICFVHAYCFLHQAILSIIRYIQCISLYSQCKVTILSITNFSYMEVIAVIQNWHQANCCSLIQLLYAYSYKSLDVSLLEEVIIYNCNVCSFLLWIILNAIKQIHCLNLFLTALTNQLILKFLDFNVFLIYFNLKSLNLNM